MYGDQDGYVKYSRLQKCSKVGMSCGRSECGTMVLGEQYWAKSKNHKLNYGGCSIQIEMNVKSCSIVYTRGRSLHLRVSY
jgi:hypothetical protein